MASLDMIPDSIIKLVIQNRHADRIAQMLSCWDDMAWEVDVVTGDTIFFGDRSTGKTYVAT